MPRWATDAFRPDQWREFFQTVGTGGAALTGLIFVAMSLNVGAITANTAHRYRAAGSLIGLASIFMLSALALMGGQHHQAIGLEILIVSGISAILFLWGYIRTRVFRGEELSVSLFRTLGTSVCYLLQVAGAAVLIANHILGLYMASVGIVASFYFTISGAWLLFVVGAASDQSPPESRTRPTLGG
jgi:hypothetical protein